MITTEVQVYHCVTLRSGHWLPGGPATGPGENSGRLHLSVGFVCNLQTGRTSRRKPRLQAGLSIPSGAAGKAVGSRAPSEPKSGPPAVGGSVSRAPGGGAWPAGRDSPGSAGAAGAAQRVRRSARRRPDHAERSARSARLSAARDTRAAVRGRQEVPARFGLAAVRGREQEGGETAPRLRPGAAGVLGVPALQEAAQVRLVRCGFSLVASRRRGGDGWPPGRRSGHPGVLRCHVLDPGPPASRVLAPPREGREEARAEPLASRTKPATRRPGSWRAASPPAAF